MFSCFLVYLGVSLIFITTALFLSSADIILTHIALSCWRNFGLGLGVNSMEPREQKHQRLKKYSQNTTPQNRWPMIFRHEFLQLIFLRERGFDEINYNRKGKKYLPDTSDNCCKTCGLDLKNSICCLCSHTIVTDINAGHWWISVSFINYGGGTLTFLIKSFSRISMQTHWSI